MALSSFLTDAQLDQLECAARRILLEAGIRVHQETVLDSLARAGARVDRARRAVYPTAEMLDAVIARQKAGQERRIESRTVTGSFAAGMGFEIAPRIYDFELRRQRLATREDLITCIRLADALPSVGHVAAPVTMGEVDPRIEAIESIALVACSTNKTVGGGSILPEHNEYFAEIFQILGASAGGPPRGIGTGGFVVTPLTLGERLCDLLLEGARYRCTGAGFGTMAIAGLSAPASIAGTVALAAAEVLGGWVAAAAVNPHLTRFGAGTATGILDMRTTRACFGAPEAALQDAAFVELFERRFGGGAGISGYGYIEGRYPGLQVATEKLTKAAIICNAIGRRPVIGSPGLLDAGAAFSLTQYMLELELAESLWTGARQFDTSDEALAVETIVGPADGPPRDFLATEHTAHHCRDFWMPALLDRRVRLAGDEADEEDIIQRADRRWREIVSAHEPPEVDPERVEAISAVLERARRRLLG